MSVYYCEGKYRPTNYKTIELIKKLSQKEEMDPVWNKDKETMDKTIKEIQTKTRDNGQALLEQNKKFEANINSLDTRINTLEDDWAEFN